MTGLRPPYLFAFEWRIRAKKQAQWGEPGVPIDVEGRTLGALHSSTACGIRCICFIRGTIAEARRAGMKNGGRRRAWSAGAMTDS